MNDLQEINYLFERLGSNFKVEPGDLIQKILFHFVDLLLDKIETLERRLDESVSRL